MRLLMMGTGEFALPTFRALIHSEHEVVGLVTQPDRAGRGHHHHPHPMKEAALAEGIAVFQPEKANAPTSLARLRSFGADLFVVAAYGQILSAELLSIPPRGAINVHASLLPKYRGAAPVQYAILNGEHETGVTIFQIEPRLDAGPILGAVATPVAPKETSGELEARLAELAAPLTLRVLQEIESGTVHPVHQDRSLVSKAPKMSKTAGEIDWSKGSDEVGRHLRAMQPWPMPYTSLQVPGREPQRMLVLDADPVHESELDERQRTVPAGQILAPADERLIVRTGNGALEILAIQPAGKRAMGTAEFLRGHSLPPGSGFGPLPDERSANERSTT